MQQVDIIIGTTHSTTTYIDIPAGYPEIALIPTTQYLEGGGGLLEADIKASRARAVQINKQAVKYNILRLHYQVAGELVRA